MADEAHRPPKRSPQGAGPQWPELFHSCEKEWLETQHDKCGSLRRSRLLDYLRLAGWFEDTAHAHQQQRQRLIAILRFAFAGHKAAFLAMVALILSLALAATSTALLASTCAAGAALGRMHACSSMLSLIASDVRAVHDTVSWMR